MLCTHLHVDHVGWNTRLVDGRWVPTFPKAKYVFPGGEWDFWKHEYEAGREKSGCIADSVVPVVEAGQATMVDSTYRIDPWLSYEPWVGHTPEHVAVRVHTSAGDAVFSGDLMHRVVQVAEPQWSSIFCYDAKQAGEDPQGLRGAPRCLGRPGAAGPLPASRPRRARRGRPPLRAGHAGRDRGGEGVSAAPMLPLEGIRVVEVAQNLAGPMAAEILAHMGADVIKVERPEGDDARKWGPPFWKGVSPGFLAVNANKRGISLDLKDPKAVAWLLDFLGTADVLVQNLRPGSLEELGLGSDVVLARHPRLVYCSVWAFGRSGPLKLKPGFEPMVQAFSGLMMMNGDEGGPPTRIGTSILDYGTGMWTAMGALAGLVQRQQTGRGCVVDASLFETGLAWLKGHFASYRASGEVPERHRTGSKRVVPFQGFETKTGTMIVAAGNDRLFAKLAAVVGHPEWAKDPRFVTNAARVDNKAALLAELDAIFLTRTKGEWIDVLEAGGVPCGPIHSLPEAVAQPQAEAIGIIQRLPGDDYDVVALPLSFDGQRPPIRRAPPRIGEHDAEIGVRS